jgi:tripartite ATP-independent transporter DctM subunit
MSSEFLILLMFISMVLGIFSGAHVAFVLGTVSIVFGFIGWGPQCFEIFVIRIWGVMNNFVLVAIPLFVFMGFILERAGLAEDLYDSMEVLFGRLRGGLAIGTIAFSTIIATCTGIVATAVVTSGLLALPSMFKRGYQKEIAMGSVAAGGTLGILIPPSIMLIFYAGESGLSAGKLFLAAFGPGLLLSFLYMAYVGIRCFFNPSLAPTPKFETRRVGLWAYLRLLKGMIPVLGLILCVLGAIIFGIATPTEAAGTGALGAMIVAAAYRKLTWELVWKSALRTIENMGMIMLLISGAVSFASVFLGLGGEDIVLDIVESLGLGQLGVVAFALIIVLAFGMFIDWAGILYITLPIFLPLVEMQGIPHLWFALLVCTTLQTAWLTPPFGFSIFFIRSIVDEEITYSRIVQACLPFVVLQLCGIILLIYFPTIITWLPNVVFK